MREWWTASELAAKALPGLPASKRGIAKFAAREGWPASELARKRKDGALEFNVALLPEHARHALAGRSLHVQALPAPGAATALRDARLAILVLQKRFADANGLRLRQSDAAFTQVYNARNIPIDDWVTEQVPKVAERSLREWRKWKEQGSDSLARGRGRSSGNRSTLETANDGAVAELIAGALVKQPHLTARHVRTLVVAAFGASLEIETDDGATLDVPVPQERAFRSYIAQWTAKNRMALAKITDPDAFKSRFRVSGFSRDGVIERVNQVWEIDASPADVLCTDGRQSVYVLIDVFSRRLMVLVSRTARSEAVLLLLRKAIIAWGVPEKVKTDNGSDFKAYAVRRAFASLSIEHHMCDPFSPEQKGKVERAIGTLQRDLMPLLPGFIGHSVADRKAIEARKAFATRLGQDDDKAFAVEITATELQSAADRWAEDDYGRRRHSALKMSPFEKAQSYRGSLKRISDVRGLDLLLAPVPGSDGIRTVGKQGLKIDDAYFTAVSLMPGEKVLVRHDPADMGRVYCFKADGSEFLCEAICYERAGINPAEAIAKARAEQARVIREEVEPLRRAARKIKPRDMVESILRSAETNASKVIAFPQAADTHTTPHLEAAAEAAAPKLERPRGPKLTEQQQRAVDAMRAEFEAGDTSPSIERAAAHTRGARTARIVDLPETPKHRFRRAYLLEKQLKDIETLPHPGVSNDDVLWLGRYQALPEYKGQKTMFEDFGEAWLFDGMMTD